MYKPTKKRNYYNEVILNELVKRHGFSVDYIRKALRNDRTGIVPDILKKEYKQLESAANSAIQENSEKL
ncbi:hypothetical protein [Elizabethkingia anophelis]|uniref:hypothetical protein n=1 Tax=Elizabethkingia anophelis TaxID=1117645 RepID=UPI0012B3E665|nr:hypothetical protein [Elizabethkingia anophelis]QGN21582.1 hypothetical protein GJV56_02615 [Elizabethkingia anophelis]QNV08244.1 hypothetical protein EIY88_02615 [Elizabethkingia anophelis]UTF89985.1 hypothetical protein J2N93_02620 [Elizabethkingia anophelis]UTG00856.1 hypothetical protein J2O04_02620 [Elizabethkingia anophelis]UTG04606.1 hypothetical protein J2O03_02625 [Elizabethkingia anophelis]